ncbi:MAG: PQQ-binding-like beta-propeller repeat protein [Bacteroidota bacterium]
MPQRWRNLLLLSLLATSTIFDSCKPKSSSDDPLPTEYYPSVIMNNDNQVVYALNPQTGTKNWELALPYKTIPPVYTFAPSPLLYGNMVYMATVNSDTLYKINAKTGAIVKKMTVSPWSFFHMYATPVADGNLVYIAGDNGILYALDTGTGATKWLYAAQDAGASFVSSPVVANGKVYIATTTGHVYAIDKTNGPDGSGFPVWDWPGNGAASTAAFISSAAITANDTNYLFIGSLSDSNMYCIYQKPPVGFPPTVGVVRWTYKTKGGIISSPAAYAGTCIFGCNDFKLYCLDTFINPNASIPQLVPRPRWIDSTNSEIYSSPIVHNQVVYVASKDYKLYAYNIINGAPKWSFATNGLIKGSPLPYKGLVYIGSYDKVMYGVDTATGLMKWSYPISGQMSGSPVLDDFSGKSYNSQISGMQN